MNLVILTLSLVIAWATPDRPIEAEHPGSDVYQYTYQEISHSIKGRDVKVYLPTPSDSLHTVIVFGHGQAIDHKGYLESFHHLAKKGYAVIHPMYDSGFFDRDWRRMAKDFNELTALTLEKHRDSIHPHNIIYSGHSKGAYIALMAAGEPNARVRPKAALLFAPAGVDANYLQNLELNMPLSLFWSEADNIIERSLVYGIYQEAPSQFKQFFELQSYRNLKADHYYPLSKSYFFGGKDGISAFHYFGVWKWLIGAAQDLENGNAISNPYIYGDIAIDNGTNETTHLVERSW